MWQRNYPCSGGEDKPASCSDSKHLAADALVGVQGHAEDLERLYRLFHEIVDVHARLVDLLQQLQQGFFIQCSVQSLMLVCTACQAFTRTPHCPLDLLQGHTA